MTREEIQAAIKDLSVADRRKVALFILELEKEHAKRTIGPQIAEDVAGVTKVLEESIEKLKKFVQKF
ncbi:MAG TPA: hypothetical protein VLY03_12400 [Bacteroidota bacterium]|nr:hypothetical protein [Bacteroidota bacterium]